MVIRRIFNPLLVLFLLPLVLAFWFLAPRFNAKVPEIVSEETVASPKVPAVKDFIAELKESQLLSLSFVYATTDEHRIQAAQRLEILESQLYQNLRSQAKMASTVAQNGLAIQALESLDNYFAAIKQALQFKVDGQQEFAEATLFANVTQYENELEQTVRTLEIEKKRAAGGK